MDRQDEKIIERNIETEMKTAYIELNTTDQIKSLSPKNSLDPFVYKGIHIFPSTKVTSVSDILSKDFDYFILDMGVLTKYTAVEFSKAIRPQRCKCRPEQ